MKSTLITLAFAFTSILTAAQTNSYTDVLVVSIDGSVVDTQTSTIQVIATANGTYELSLRNFILKNPTDPTPVGNISLSNITVTEQDGIKNRLIQAGLSEHEIIAELELMEQKFPKNADTFLRIISGKDYLIHLMSCHAKKSLNYNTGHSKEAWKFNFAQYCKLDRLEHLKTIILTCL